LTDELRYVVGATLPRRFAEGASRSDRTV